MKNPPQKPSLVKKAALAASALLVLGAGIILGWYFLTLKDPRLPGMPMKVQILTAALPELTENLSSLEAGDLALASASLSSLKAVLQEWESSGLPSHPLGKYLLSSPASAGLPEQGGWIISADLGWKGLWAPLALEQLALQDQPLLGWLEDGGARVFFHPPASPAPGEQIWIRVQGNLLLMASEKEILARASESLDSPEPEKPTGSGLEFPEEGLRFTLSPEWLEGRIAAALPGARKKMPPDSADRGVTVNLRLDDRTLLADFPWEAPFSGAMPMADQSAWSRLPRETVFALICPWIPEIIYSWAGLPVPDKSSIPWVGGEVGIFFHSGAADPVAVIGLADKKRWEEAKKTLVSPTSGRLLLPASLQSLLQLADFSGTEADYFDQGDFLFLSPSPLGLAPLKKPLDQTLAATPEFQALTAGILPAGTLSAYADLDRKTPFFFQDSHPLLETVRLYSRSLFRLIPLDQGWKMEVRGLKGRSPLARTVPGYPHPIPEEATVPFFVIPGSGTSPAKLAYRLTGGGLLLQDPLDFSLSALSSRDTFPPLPGIDDRLIYVPGEEGFLDAFLPDGSRAPGFPKSLRLEGPVRGVPFPGGILIYQGSKTELHQSGPNAGEGISVLLPAAPEGVPVQRFGYISLLLGDRKESALLMDLRGKFLKGWPKTAGFPLAGPPVILKSGTDIHLALVGKDGDLALSDLHGDLLPGYPVKLQESFTSTPAVMELQGEELLVFLSTSGKVILFDPASGQVLRSAVAEGTSPDSEITLFDGNRDGKPEIFVSEVKGQIMGFDAQLEPLPDFPVQGKGLPQFCDLEGDGFLELLSQDDSRRVYAYSLRY